MDKTNLRFDFAIEKGIEKHWSEFTKDDFLQYSEWLEKKLLNVSDEGQSEQFVCAHPPKQTYLIDGIYHCEKCGGKWEGIANKRQQ